MTVFELAEELNKLNQEATIHITCGKTGGLVPPDKVTVSDNDDDTPVDYELHSSYEGVY